MATVTDSTRTTLLKRAAIAWIVCGELLFCGCRAPWRSWRNDEPSLEQLLLHPEPWDAEARLQQESPSRRTGSPQPSDKNYSDRNLGRANPYAARSGDESHAGDGQAADNSDQQSSRAEFEAAYAAAPPHLRGLLKRQWEATQALNSRQPVGDRRRDSDADAGANVDAIAYEGGDEGEEADVSIAPRTRSGGNAPVSYRMSDDESGAEQSGREEVAGEQSASGRSLGAQPNVARKSRPAASDRSEDEGTVTYSLNDAEQEDAVERLTERRAPLEELNPPPTKKPARRVAHAEPIDTGAGDDVLMKPSATASKHSAQQTTVASDNRPPKRAADQPSASYVTTASAEVKADAAASSSIAPAVAADDEELARAKELGWRDHVREALRELEEESANATETPAEKLHRQATGRMLRLALGELEPALRPIEGLQPHEQEFFRHQFQSLHDAIDPKGNPVLSRRWTLALDSHRKAMSHLAAVSNLEIKNANFCTDVHSYGVVSKFPNPHFKPNQELLLYCELDNFSAEPVKDGYETQLQGSYEIVDASGHRVADMLLPEDADICRNQRRDYFIAYRIYMPQKIEPGRYQLRLTIEDMKGRKFGQTSLDFQIGP